MGEEDDGVGLRGECVWGNSIGMGRGLGRLHGIRVKEKEMGGPAGLVWYGIVLIM